MSKRRDAEETKEWDRFWDSGKVEDYLRYKDCQEERFSRGQEHREFLEERDRFS